MPDSMIKLLKNFDFRAPKSQNTSRLHKVKVSYDYIGCVNKCMIIVKLLVMPIEQCFHSVIDEHHRT